MIPSHIGTHPIQQYQNRADYCGMGMLRSPIRLMLTDEGGLSKNPARVAFDERPSCLCGQKHLYQMLTLSSMNCFMKRESSSPQDISLVKWEEAILGFRYVVQWKYLTKRLQEYSL